MRYRLFHRPGQVRCSNCGYLGKPKLQQKGSTILCLFLWLCFIVPGFFYTLWMLGAKEWICPKCENDKVFSDKSGKTMPGGAAIVVPVGGLKKCPFCAEMIQPEAVKCRFCGERLTAKA